MSAPALKVPDPAPVAEDSTTREVIGGRERLAARPAQPHIHTASQLHTELNYRFGGFKGGERGPGGWLIYHEPELKLVGDDPVVPDISGWRRERLSRITREGCFRLVPDWICEVLSPGTRVWDREVKMPFYAQQRVGYLWLVDPLDQLLEVHALGRRGWEGIGTFSGDKVVRLEPFEDIELDLSLIWPPL